MQLGRSEIVRLLSLDDFSPIYAAADQVRRDNVGDVVHLRAIIEFSNICKRQCIYCGLNCHNKDLRRFRMSHEEIVQTAAEAVDAGYRTIVLQSGEDDYFTVERLGDIVRDIKSLRVKDRIDKSSLAEFSSGSREAEPPAVTLSCGEMSREELAYLKEAGADRYLLKHETANPELYSRLHPCGTLENRTHCLKAIHDLGYETGSGFMVGLPGQTLEMIADDLLLLKELSCKMAGIGPFIANPKTPLGHEPCGDAELARRAVAIGRLLLPEANLPLTTALSVLSKAGQAGAGRPERTSDAAAGSREGSSSELCMKNDEGMMNPFAGGANVIMKKVTPDEYKEAYEIYPADFAPTDIAGDRKQLEEIIRSYGRIPL